MSQQVNQRPIGIDLGTTYSAIAYLDTTGRPVSVSNAEGDLLTPSAVSFESGEVTVGKEAVKSSVFEPHVFADCFKRDIGSPVFRRPLGTQQVPPEVLSAFLLEKLKRDAEAKLGEIRQVVITVPAFFDETRRHATQEAGRLAGLDVLDIINEPTAAAIAYCYYRTILNASQQTGLGRPERLLVYDLGGGTFDVTVLEVQGRNLRALATDGDVQLGGRDFDECLVDYVAQQFEAEHGVDPRSDPHDAFQLWMDAQTAKHSLSTRSNISIPCFHAGIRMRVDISRSLFDQLTAPLLNRTESTTQLVLRQANLTWKDIDRVLLVGGSSRMPMVAEMLQRVSGKEPDKSLSPDEAVAHGAAIYAGMIAGSRDVEQHTLKVVNVNSHSLGIIGLNRRANRKQNVIIIPKNTALPCRAVRKFVTARDNQSNVKITIVEGESKQPEHCISLGQCVVRNLPRGLPKNTVVEVEYRYEANGRISVEARVPSVRQSAHVEIEHEHSNDLATLEEWRAKLTGGEPAGPNNLEPQANEVAIPNSFSTLDLLLIRLGAALVTRTVPESLLKCQADAIQARKQLQSAIVLEKKVRLQREKAIGQAELLTTSANVALAKSNLQEATIQARFAELALGQACMNQKCWPPEHAELAAEISRLRDDHSATL